MGVETGGPRTHGLQVPYWDPVVSSKRVITCQKIFFGTGSLPTNVLTNSWGGCHIFWGGRHNNVAVGFFGDHSCQSHKRVSALRNDWISHKIFLHHPYFPSFFAGCTDIIFIYALNTVDHYWEYCLVVVCSKNETIFSLKFHCDGLSPAAFFNEILSSRGTTINHVLLISMDHMFLDIAF